MNELLNEHEVAKLLSIPTSTLRYWRLRGDGPAWSKVGRLVRYDLEDVKRYVDQQKRRPVRANMEEGRVGLQAR